LEAKEVFQEIDDSLNQSLSKVMFEGPEDQLILTENAQPALMAVSLAVIRVIERQGSISIKNTARYVAGHSLGEYSALAAAGSISIADTARLLKKRGCAMQEAVPVGQGAMAALIGLDLDSVREVISESSTNEEVCAAANDNAPGQIVISGHTAAVERAADLAKNRGAKKAIMLAVSAPFHCSLMAPAAEVMEGALSNVRINPPIVPLIANFNANSIIDPAEIKQSLVSQIVSMVRWRESIQLMAEAGVDTLIEVGSGRVLTGLARRIDRKLNTLNLQNPADIDTFLKLH
jgi:[acyl-carrier-protein] S-malonyltransferase